MNTTLLTLLLVACSPEPASTDTAPTDAAPTDTAVSTDTDGDGDGVAASEDCDDTDAAVYPGAAETWYDGTDSDCDGRSDYDADGDGLDAIAYGGEDCDDTDSAVGACEPSDLPLDHYSTDGVVFEISEISSNLSGITWNPATGTYLIIRDSNKRIHELAADFTHLREITLENVTHTDLEDIAYLGSDGDDHEVALVAEDGTMYIVTVPDDGSTTIDLDDAQLITYADAPSVNNSGGEGVAYDRDTGRFWVCIEKNPMTIYTFTRPTGSADVSYDSGLTVTEPFDAAAAFDGTITDVSSCYFDPRTQRLLVLSHESKTVLDVDLDGTILTSMAVDSGLTKPEGLTINDDQDMVLSGEANDMLVYTYSGE